jgi:hypothetical protein
VTGTLDNHHDAIERNKRNWTENLPRAVLPGNVDMILISRPHHKRNEQHMWTLELLVLSSPFINGVGDIQRGNDGTWHNDLIRPLTA